MIDEERYEEGSSPLAEAKRAVEAVVLVSPDPVSEELLARIVHLTEDVVSQLCVELAAEYKRDNRGFELVEIAGGWRYQSRSDLSEFMERFALDDYSSKISSAALETLSIVAYKQPISRAQVAAIRGVNADGVLKTLTQRGYVEEVGQDDGPGKAILFGTSRFFLEQLGLASLDDLPALGEFVPSAAVLEVLEKTLHIDAIDEEPGVSEEKGDPAVSIDEALGLEADAEFS